MGLKPFIFRDLDIDLTADILAGWGVRIGSWHIDMWCDCWTPLNMKLGWEKFGGGRCLWEIRCSNLSSTCWGNFFSGKNCCPMFFPWWLGMGEVNIGDRITIPIKILDDLGSLEWQTLLGRHIWSPKVYLKMISPFPQMQIWTCSLEDIYLFNRKGGKLLMPQGWKTCELGTSF